MQLRFYTEFSKRLPILVLVLCLSPLLFLGTDLAHDFGDDFAQYLDQALDVVYGQRQAPDVEHSETYSPSERGAGFSLVLIPIYWSQGLTNGAYLVFISFLLIAAALSMFYLFQKEFSDPVRQWLLVVGVLVFAYNFQILRVKDEIMPEFLFIALLVGVLLLLQSKNKFSYVLAFLVMGWLTTVKEIGWLLPIAVVLQWIFTRKKRLSFYKLSFGLGLTVLLHFAVNWMVFGRLSAQHISWYAQAFDSGTLVKTLLANSSYYALQLPQFFEQELWGWLIHPFAWGAIAVLIIGAVHSWRKQTALMDIYVVLHMLVLLLYSNNKSTIRFLIPIFPFLVIYFVRGSETIQKTLRIRWPYFPHTAVFILLFSNFKNAQSALTQNNEPSPFAAESIELWETIESQVDENKVIGFYKPWTLHLFTGRIAAYLPVEGYNELQHQPSLDFVVVHKASRSDPQDVEPQNGTKMFENEDFALYQIEPNNVLLKADSI